MSKKKVTYVVQKDNILGFIAKSHGMSLKELLETPGNEQYTKNPNLIHPNDKVVVSSKYKVEPWGKDNVYKAPLTLQAIASTHMTTVDQLLQLPANNACKGQDTGTDLTGTIVELPTE